MSVDYQYENGIAQITIDDGKVNAMSAGLFSQINAALDKAENDKTITIMSGREGIFSAGYDLGELLAGPESALQILRDGAALCLRLLQFPYPVIAACTGNAYPMGAFILMSCDYRIGCSGEFKLGMNEVRINITPPLYALEVARGRLHPAYLNRTVVTGEMFSPQDSVNAGILDEVVEIAELPARAMAVAEDFKSIGAANHADTKLRLRANWIKAIEDTADTELVIENIRQMFGQ